MKQNNVGCITVIVIAVAGLAYCGRSTYVENARNKDRELKRQRAEEEDRKKTAAFAGIHNAVTGWFTGEPFDQDDKQLGESPYSVEITEAFMRQDNRPLAILVEVTDVSKVSNEYQIEAVGSETSKGCTIYYHLRAAKAVGDVLLSHKERAWGQACLIVKMGSIKKASFVLSDAPENALLTISTSDTTYIARGEASAVLRK